MTFSKDYASTISPFVEQFKASKNEKARKAVLKNAAKAVSDSRRSLEDEGVNLPKDLEKVSPFSHSSFLLMFINPRPSNVTSRNALRRNPTTRLKYLNQRK